MTPKPPATAVPPGAPRGWHLPGSTAALWRQIVADFERAAVRT